MPEQSKFKVGVEYKTRDGRRARVYALDHGSISSPNICGATLTEGRWTMRVWYLDGRGSKHTELYSDLMPNTKKVECWINLYKERFGGVWYDSEEAATIAAIGGDRVGFIKTIHIIEEVEE